jgi:CubicO group peptidase (beta-lactamase class C family)
MSVEERVNLVVDEAVESGKITGTVVLVHKHGKPLVRRAAGFADREAAQPIALDTIFRLASVTKPVVAATALAMVERGTIALDDTVATYLPWFRPKTTDGATPDITIHHLLTHTSGLAYDSALELLPEPRRITAGLADTDLDFEGNFARHNAVPLTFAPGTRWEYSFATDILGAVIAKAHGGTLEDAVVTYVAGPLGMRDTRFHVTDPARLAVPYGDTETLPVRMSDPWVAGGESGWTIAFSPGRIFNAKAFQSGGAGAVGTAGDMMTFLEALRLGGSCVLKPETVAAGMTNRIGAIEREEPGMKFGYFGAVVENPDPTGAPQSKGTVRWGGVYGHNWFIDPVEGLSVISMTNNAIEGCTGQYPDRIVNAVYGV